jgi:hypothetical protein
MMRCKLHLEFFDLRALPTFLARLHVPETTSESRRDGVNVAQDVSPGYSLDQDQNSPAGTADRCVRSIQPSLAGLDTFC